MSSDNRFEHGLETLCKELGLTEFDGGDEQGFGGEDVPTKKAMATLKRRLLPLLMAAEKVTLSKAQVVVSMYHDINALRKELSTWQQK